MEKSILSREDMSQMIKECIRDLKNGGSKTMDLSHLMHCIGTSKNDKVLLATFPILGSFAGELVRFRQLALLPMIPPELKKRHTTLLKKAIKAGEESLEDLRVLLCEKNKSDYRRIVGVLATLTKHDFALAREWRALTKSRPSATSS